MHILVTFCFFKKIVLATFFRNRLINSSSYNAPTIAVCCNDATRATVLRNIGFLSFANAGDKLSRKASSCGYVSKSSPTLVLGLKNSFSGFNYCFITIG